MILGHEKIIKYLEKISADKKNTAHSFLFSGKEGIGKKTVALEFAKSLACLEAGAALGGCGKCGPCIAAANGTNPDLIYIDPKEISKKEEKSENIPIEHVRELKKSLSLNPYYEGSMKVAIINDAHKMTGAGFNALLKTLEEPPSKSVIVLISAFHEIMPETILSRVQILKFSGASVDEIKGFLEKSGIKTSLKDIVFLAEKPSWIFENNNNGLKNRKKFMDDFYLFLSMPLEERYDYAELLLKKEDELEDIFSCWLFALKTMAAEKIFATDGVSFEKIVPADADRLYDIRDVIKITKDLLELNFIVKTTNVNKKIALDTFVLNIEREKK